MAVCDRPEWLNNGVCGTSKKAKIATASSNKSVFSSSNSSSSSQTSLRSFAIPHLNTTEQKKFNQEIAMHFYCTATSFTRIEDPHLLHAVQLGNLSNDVLAAGAT